MTNLPSNESQPRSRRSRRELSADSYNPGALRAIYDKGIVAWKLLWDKRVSLLPKMIPLAALAYVLSPVDILPELIAGPLAPLALLDDVSIILLGFNMFINAAPPDIVQEYLRQLSGNRDTGLGLDPGDDDVIDGEILDQ